MLRFLRFLRSMTVYIICSVIISLLMSLLITALFSYPASQKSLENELLSLQSELMVTEGKIANLKALEDAHEISAHDTATLRSYEASRDKIKLQIVDYEQSEKKISYLDMALKNWLDSFLIQFPVLFIVILIVASLIKKAIAHNAAE